ncbi:hypothetical protein CDL12_13116 [Handroanthus impetiginosus]|uniref:F-box domain-containing protein n=1 Tax=Handroanthus impetiginosus TaxID=429701 RepID=A0A2G9H9Q9_9LAMI|nr:hypothetical protein CDL12_13116 [Handroanthus impetiginosus]
MLPWYIGLFLPNEVICAILCWLPVVSLLRFKSVCRHWNSITQDCKFINEHICRSPGLWVHKTISTTPTSQAEYVCLTSCTGLTLEAGTFTRKFRLRNPSTRKILDLPEPNRTVYRDSNIAMCYVPSTSDVKLVYPYSNAVSYGCCKILTAGTDPAWRKIDLSFCCNPANFNVETILIDNVYYVMRLSGDQEMFCLEMENEQLSRIKIPRYFFLDWTRVWSVEWRGKLSLACIEDDGIHLWVLENWREQKWAENKNDITGELFSEDYKSRNMVPCLFEDEGWLVHCNHERIVHLLMEAVSGKGLDSQDKPARRIFSYYFEPSLLHVKGMQRDRIKEFFNYKDTITFN